MSILFYKQRHRNPNLKDTAGANYAHVRYIAGRPGVLKNEGMDHGLFGKLEPGRIQEFEDWRRVAKLCYGNSQRGITMYRSIVSFSADTAKELLLKNQRSWQRYIENHILTIAEKNHIRREHLQWAAAVHGEKKHPHLHVVFWDASARVKNPYTPPEIPDAIRRQMIKDTFVGKILMFAKEKDAAIKEMRQITDSLVKQFENDFRCKNPGSYKNAGKMLSEELDTGVFFSEELLRELAGRLLRLKETMPERGRLSYQLLPPESKEKTDELVSFLLNHVTDIRQCFERYVEAKYKMAVLYADDEAILGDQKRRFEKEAEKILANRVLSGVRMLFRLESEGRSAGYMESRQEYFASRLLMEALDMLAQMIWKKEDDYDRHRGMAGELSKEARKELFMRNQDKGYEH